MDSYRRLDQSYDKYWNVEEKYCEINNSDLISLSNELTYKYNSPIEKAEAIFNWVVENIKYDKDYSGGGALETFYTKKGTCGDFSDLMMALLRIQNIPTRKAYGYILDDVEEIEEKRSYLDNVFYSHSWIEYFVPNIGWIACDPTFGDSDPQYFNGLDLEHIYTYVGGATEPEVHEIIEILGTFKIGNNEYTEDWLNGHSPDYPYDFDYKVSISIIEKNVEPDPLYLIIYAAWIIGLIGIPMSELLILRELRRNYKNEHIIFKYELL